MVRLTVLGGAGGIGGSNILVEDKESRLFLDLGSDFELWKRFYSGFLQARKFNSIDDLIRFGLLPDMKGIFREDYLRHMGRPEEEKALDGIVISHAHIDHSGNTHFIRRDIPFYMSQASFWIEQSMQETIFSQYYELLDMNLSYDLVLKTKEEEGYKRSIGLKKARDIRIVMPGEAFKVANLELVTYPVDHSMMGSVGTVVFSDKGPIVYSGDKRVRGKTGEKSRRFIEECSRLKPYALICEGTRIDELEEHDEGWIFEEAVKAVKKTRGLVLMEHPKRHLERIKLFQEVAKETGRILIIDPQHAHLMSKFSPDYGLPKLDLKKNMGLYLSRKGWGILDREFDERVKNAKELMEQDYFEWERPYISHKARVPLSEIRAHPEQFIFSIDFYSLNDLHDLQPPAGSCYIRSITEPFDDDTALQERIRKNWLQEFGINDVYRLHVSGHMNQAETREIVMKLKPEVLIPIHTEKPGVFNYFYEQAGLKGGFIIPTKNNPIDL